MDLESEKALERYGHFNSTHEVYGVLMEEVQEFFNIVKLPYTENKDQLIFKRTRMAQELKQIRSIADRAIKELDNNKIKFV